LRRGGTLGAPFRIRPLITRFTKLLVIIDKKKRAKTTPILVKKYSLESTRFLGASNHISKKSLPKHPVIPTHIRAKLFVITKPFTFNDLCLKFVFNDRNLQQGPPTRGWPRVIE